MTILQALRFQLFITLSAGILIPYAIAWSQRPSLSYSYEGARFALWASIAATSWAVVFANRYFRMPFRTGWNLIIPAFAMAYAFVFIIFALLRIPYSIIIFVISFTGSTLTFLAVFFESRRSQIYSYFYVPGGRIQRIADLKRLSAQPLAAPELPDVPNAIIIADLHYDHADAWERMLARAALDGIPVFHAKQVWEEMKGRVLIEHLSENNLGTLLPNMPWMTLKRFLDTAAVLVLLPILLLPMAIVALVIKLDSPGPVMFRQTRIGFRGEPFRVFKFRTMRVAAADGGGAALDRAKTKSDDDRITKVGHFLRRSRIDELPQMINILAGEMSWIGPRPEAEALSQWYEDEIPFYSYRHIIRPGITGWAQVNQGHVTELTEISHKLQYDFYYIRNFSPWLDALIMLRTLKVMVTGFGSR